MTLEVALVLVGDELLGGDRRDANGPWLARKLAIVGARVTSMVITGDAARDTVRAVRNAAAHANLVIVSGGLGPTDDDGTREALATAAGVDLREDPAALAMVRAAQEARGFELDDRRRREARLPAGASPVPNPTGTAPGIEMQVGDALLFALPGVPSELQSMVEASVLPRLGGLGSLDPLRVAAFRVAGVREPDVANLLADLDGGGVALGLYPHQGELEIRFTAQDAAAEAAAAEARRRLAGIALYEDVPIEEAAVEGLKRRGLALTTAESLTGGLLARMVTAVPGASEVFRGGWVVYSDAWKAARLGVSEALLETEGAVSPEVARAMADGARRRAGADVALSLTGIAGPGDGRTPDGRPIPQGTYYVGLALAGRETEVSRHRAPHERTIVQRRAAVRALAALLRALGAG